MTLLVLSILGGVAFGGLLGCAGMAFINQREDRYRQEQAEKAARLKRLAGSAVREKEVNNG